MFCFRNAFLARPNSLQQLEALKLFALQNGITENFWVGFYDEQKSGQYKDYFTGTNMPAIFFSGQPNDNDDQCAASWYISEPHFGIYDVSCDYIIPAVCETPATIVSLK